MSMEGIDESLHGLGGIEEIPSKIEVFSRTQQLRFGGTRDSGGYSTRLDGLNHYKESRSHQESSHQLVLMNRQKKIEIQSNETQDEQERDEFKTPEGTRREGPPFPINLRTKSLRIHTSNP